MRRLRIRIRILVFERFDEFVEQHCEESAADGTDPVHPLSGVEGARGDGRTEGAGGVERSAGPEDACRLMLEEGACDKTVELEVEKGGGSGLDPKGGRRLTN